MKKGFTLIELMVTVTIIILISGLALASYYNFTQQQAVLNDARNLSTILKKVLTMAKDQVYPNGCSGLTGYRISTVCAGSGCTKMNAQAICTSGGSINVINGETVFVKNSFGTAIDMTFAAGSGYVSSPLSYSISSTSTVKVTVDKNGNINIMR